MRVRFSSTRKATDPPCTARRTPRRGAAARRDATSDQAWTAPDPGDVLREMDRFHRQPPVAEFASSWAEWLYFNGRGADVQFYLTFLVGPSTRPGKRSAAVRLQLERNGRQSNYSSIAEVDEETVHPIRSTTLAQPALFLIEYALAQRLVRFGVEPAALIFELGMRNGLMGGTGRGG